MQLVVFVRPFEKRDVFCYGAVCLYVCLYVCMSVCLSVTPVTQKVFDLQ